MSENQPSRDDYLLAEIIKGLAIAHPVLAISAQNQLARHALDLLREIKSLQAGGYGSTALPPSPSRSPP